MKITIQIAIGLLMFTGILFTQQLEWAARYTGSAGYEQHINDAVTDKYGNTYICGFIQLPNQINTKDAIILKVNSAGVVEWTKIYAGIDSREDEYMAIDIDNIGNAYVTGFSFSFSSLTDILTIKYNSNGDTVWTKKYNNSNDVDLGSDIKTDLYGNTFITGYSYFPGPNSDYITIRYDSAGNQLWTRFYNGSGNSTDIGRKITIDLFGNLIVSGLSKRNLFNNDVATIKYDISGNVIWSKIYSGDNNEGANGSTGLQCDPLGNVYFMTGVPSGPRRIVKYDMNGDSVWIKLLAPGLFEVALQVRQNDFYASFSKEGDFFTGKFNLNGDTLWNKIYPVQTYQSDDTPRDAITDNHGNFYITGYCDSNWLAYDYLTVKYDSLGNLKWSKRYSLALFADDKAYKIGLDTADNVYVTGISGGQITTIKYSQPPVGVINIGSEIPLKYKLHQNYPNPFNPSTAIKFDLPENTFVSLKVFNAIGQQVAELVNNEFRLAGSYSVNFDGSNLASGIYFYSIEAGSFKDVKKMVLIK